MKKPAAGETASAANRSVLYMQKMQILAALLRL
jgi:hypothetical protein